MRTKKRAVQRILLADPQHASRRALSRLLEDSGFDVQTVSNGGDVILQCESEPPDILILDVDLPDMDGFEVCHQVRCDTAHADVTIIIVTEPKHEMMRNSLGHMVEFAGGDFFFARPFDGRLLAQFLEDFRDDDDNTSVARRACSPTRVVWPTARSRSLSMNGCLS